MPTDRLERDKHTILLLIFVGCSVVCAYLLTRQPLVLIRSDHYSRWYATQKLVDTGRSLYDARNGVEVMAQNPSPGDPIYADFYYPAYLIVLVLPLVRLPYPAAHFLWLTTIQLFMILAVWMIYKEIRWPATVNRLTVIMALSVLFLPNLQNFIWGQFNTIAAFALAATVIALRRGRYFLAGILAAGLAFKPQQMLLTMALLLLWSLFERPRWRFVFGFSAAMLGLYLFAALFEPGWVGSFLAGLQRYSQELSSPAIIARFGASGWVAWLFITALWAVLLIQHRKAAPNSPVFAAHLAMSAAIWWLFAPVVGMMHLVVLPIIVMLLLEGLAKVDARLYPAGIGSCLLLYFLGLAGFYYGLSSPERYGLHIQFSELAYKLGGPILLIGLACPLISSRRLIERRTRRRLSENA